MVLERNEAVASSWRGHYDRLHLHTVRWLSGLPGPPIPREEGSWVSRDGVVRYLENYTVHHGIEVRAGVAVDKVERVLVLEARGRVGGRILNHNQMASTIPVDAPWAAPDAAG